MSLQMFLEPVGIRCRHFEGSTELINPQKQVTGKKHRFREGIAFQVFFARLSEIQVEESVRCDLEKMSLELAYMLFLVGVREFITLLAGFFENPCFLAILIFPISNEGRIENQ